MRLFSFVLLCIACISAKAASDSDAFYTELSMLCAPAGAAIVATSKTKGTEFATFEGSKDDYLHFLITTSRTVHVVPTDALQNVWESMWTYAISDMRRSMTTISEQQQSNKLSAAQAVAFGEKRWNELPNDVLDQCTLTVAYLAGKGIIPLEHAPDASLFVKSGK
jgi:hypothetical protein